MRLQEQNTIVSLDLSDPESFSKYREEQSYFFSRPNELYSCLLHAYINSRSFSGGQLEMIRGALSHWVPQLRSDDLPSNIDSIYQSIASIENNQNHHVMDEAWGQCLQQVMKHQPLLVDGLSNDYIHAPIMKYTQSWSLLMKYNFSQWADLLSTFKHHESEFQSARDKQPIDEWLGRQLHEDEVMHAFISWRILMLENQISEYYRTLTEQSTLRQLSRFIKEYRLLRYQSEDSHDNVQMMLMWCMQTDQHHLSARLMDYVVNLSALVLWADARIQKSRVPSMQMIRGHYGMNRSNNKNDLNHMIAKMVHVLPAVDDLPRSMRASYERLANMIDDSEFIRFFSRNPAMSDQVSSRMISVFCDKALMPSVVVCLAGLLIGLWFQNPSCVAWVAASAAVCMAYSWSCVQSLKEEVAYHSSYDGHSASSFLRYHGHAFHQGSVQQSYSRAAHQGMKQ